MIREILEEGRQVNLTMRAEVEHTDGQLDQEELKGLRSKLFKFVNDYLEFDILQVQKSFPKDDMVTVDMSIDIVVLQGEDYRRIIKRLDSYARNGEDL